MSRDDGDTPVTTEPDLLRGSCRRSCPALGQVADGDIDLEAPSDAPSGGGGADPPRAVATNLLSNAVKY